MIGKTIDFESESNMQPTIRNRIDKHSKYRIKYPKLCKDLDKMNAGTLQATTKQIASKYNTSEATIFRIKNSIYADI